MTRCVITTFPSLTGWELWSESENIFAWSPAADSIIIWINACIIIYTLDMRFLINHHPTTTRYDNVTLSTGEQADWGLCYNYISILHIIRHKKKTQSKSAEGENFFFFLFLPRAKKICFGGKNILFLLNVKWSPLLSGFQLKRIRLLLICF